MQDPRYVEDTRYSLSPLWEEIRAELRRNRAARLARENSTEPRDGRPPTRTDSAPGFRLGRRRARDGSGRR
jgi:hypothetical protein